MTLETTTNTTFSGPVQASVQSAPNPLIAETARLLLSTDLDITMAMSVARHNIEHGHKHLSPQQISTEAAMEEKAAMSRSSEMPIYAPGRNL